MVSARLVRQLHLIAISQAMLLGIMWMSFEAIFLMPTTFAVQRAHAHVVLTENTTNHRSHQMIVPMKNQAMESDDFIEV